jgi:hypothetical protein
MKANNAKHSFKKNLDIQGGVAAGLEMYKDPHFPIANSANKNKPP